MLSTTEGDVIITRPARCSGRVPVKRDGPLNWEFRIPDPPASLNSSSPPSPDRVWSRVREHRESCAQRARTHGRPGVCVTHSSIKRDIAMLFRLARAPTFILTQRLHVRFELVAGGQLVLLVQKSVHGAAATGKRDRTWETRRKRSKK